MLNITDVTIGQRISFEIYPVNQFGNVFQNVEYCGSFDATLAQNLGLDIAAAHGNVYSSLPAGTPKDYLKYAYCRLKMPSGEYQILAHEWIRAGTVVVSDGGTGTLTFYNIDRVTFDRMIAACRANGRAPDSSVLN